MSMLDQARNKEANELQLNPRLSKILRGIVLTFTETAEPVGSKNIQKDFGINASSATIRNDMATLEGMGLIYQPHTSAGRVPTDLGFRVFVDQLMQARQLSRKIFTDMQNAVTGYAKQADERARAHQLANLLAGLANDIAYVVNQSQKNSAVAGLHLLLRQPEAHDTVWVADLLCLLEDDYEFMGAIEEYDARLGDSTQSPVKFYIGNENRLIPLQRCTIVQARVRDPFTGEPTLVGFIAPKRMAYPQAASLLKSLYDLLT